MDQHFQEDHSLHKVIQEEPEQNQNPRGLEEDQDQCNVDEVDVQDNDNNIQDEEVAKEQKHCDPAPYPDQLEVHLGDQDPVDPSPVNLHQLVSAEYQRPTDVDRGEK